jgi:urocanate hydratase
MTGSGPHSASDYQPVRAPRGAALSCKGWQQEAVLRMLLNSLDPEVAERPQDLVISGAAGKAAAGWDSFRSIVASLKQLEGDESLVVESGKPAGISRTSVTSPRVLLTRAAGSEAGGGWLYAGTQSALPVLYELYAAAARRHFDGTLAGKLVIAGGLGGAGGAQPLAAALNGAAFLGIDADPERIKRRLKAGYCEVLVNRLDEALRMLKNAVRRRSAVSIGLTGNCAAVFPELAHRGVVPDLLTDCTPTEEPFDTYVPLGLTPESASALRHADAAAFRQRTRDSLVIHFRGLQELQKLGARVLNPRDYLQPLAEEKLRLSTWLTLSGEPGDIACADRLALELFAADERLTRWIALARKYVRFQGLPARVAWLGERQMAAFSSALNGLVARGQIAGPVLVGFGFPFPEQAPGVSMPSAGTIGKDLPSAESGACWVSLRDGAGQGDLRQARAQAIVADGSADAGERIARWLPAGADPMTT